MRRRSSLDLLMMGPKAMPDLVSTPWTPTQTANSLTWNCETFAQNQNANAIRWGTLYNFRFDADQPPQTTNATVDFFKTGSPMTVAIQAPAGGGTPTPTATPTPTPSATPRRRPRARNRPARPIWDTDVYRRPESHRHWTFVILPAMTSTSKGPYFPMLLVLPFRETL